MKSLYIKGSNENPDIICDAINGLIEIKGRSIGEDPLMQIYSPIILWLEKYKDIYQPTTTINVRLTYINSGSMRSLLNIFKRLKALQNDNDDAIVVINWYYNENDEDMLETGESYEEMSDLKFNFYKSKSDNSLT